MNQVWTPLNSYTLRFLPQCLKEFRKCSSFSKELPKQQPWIAQNTDLLINNFKNARSVYGVLELVNTHYKIMNPHHTIQALKTIFSLQKYGNSDISTSTILKHPDFEKICNHLKYHAGAIELREAIEALKVMTFVGVSSDSTICQILLQLLKHGINKMSLQQIIFLDFLLSKVKPTPLVQAIQIALPIVYDIQLPVQLDKSNLESLTEQLQYVSKKDVSNESVTLIANSLMKVKVFDVKSSISIIWSICDMERNEFFEPLLNKAFKSLHITGYDTSYEELETILSKLVNKYINKMPFYYNEALFERCAEVLILEDLGFEFAVHLLKKFLKVSHINNELLNYISEKCYQNPDLIINGDPRHVYHIICGCALTEFRPKYHQIINDSFLKIMDFRTFDDNREINFLNLQVALGVLDIYIPEMLEKCFREDNLDRISKRRYFPDLENILVLSQAIATFKQEFYNNLPSLNYLSKVKSKLKPIIDYPLEGSLYHVFGGEKYVKTRASTKMLHHVDHLIVLRKGGFPCTLNPSDTYIEDIQCEFPNQIVLIMALNNLHYTINCKRLKGSTSLMLRTLEAKGYSVVPICLETWTSLPDFEKLPYIMEAIKSSTEYFDRAYTT